MEKIINFKPEFRIFNGPPTTIFGGVILNLKKFDIGRFKEEVVPFMDYALEPISIAYEIDPDVSYVKDTLLVKMPKEAKLDNYFDMDVSNENNDFATFIRNHKDKERVCVYPEKKFTLFVYRLDEILNPQKLISFVENLEDTILRKSGLDYNIKSYIDENNVVVKTVVDKLPEGFCI